MRLPDIDHRGHPVAPCGVLLAAGLSHYRLRTAVAAGKWQEALPGVLVRQGGHLTRLERWAAALCYGGEHAVLSHRSALLALGARVAEPARPRRAAGVRGDYVPPDDGGLVEVTVPHGHHLRSVGFVVVHQSRRPVAPVLGPGRLLVTDAARAAVDAGITAERGRDVDHVVADVLQRGLTTVPSLEHEAAALGRRLPAWLRASLADARRGMRSVGEADLRKSLTLARVPEQEWGAAIDTPEGTCFVDAIQRADVVLFRYPVRRLRADPLGCGAEIYRLVA